VTPGRTSKKVIVTAANQTRPRTRKAPLLVAIVGGSGSGKTWLAEKLQKALAPKAALFSLDNFYRDRSQTPVKRRASINFDDPRAIDWPEVERVLQDCLAGRATRLPNYDYCTHCRRKDFSALKPKPIILIDGLWLLRRRSIARLFGLKIFLDCPVKTRLRRRLSRDVLSRGRNRASITQQFWRTVQPMHAKYIAPQKKHADLVLKENCNPREVRALISLILAAR
jgi:uridine kinase